jgi:hypothetical protein
MDGCECGCVQSPEARKMAETVHAERLADFERYCLFNRPAKPLRPLSADHETRALALTHPVARRVR